MTSTNLIISNWRELFYAHNIIVENRISGDGMVTLHQHEQAQIISQSGGFSARDMIIQQTETRNWREPLKRLGSMGMS